MAIYPKPNKPNLRKPWIGNVYNQASAKKIEKPTKMQKIKLSPSGLSIGNEERILPWEQVRGLRYPIFGKTPYIQTTQGEKLSLDLPPTELKPLLLEFFRLWKEKSPYLAQKNAFDYCEPPGSGAVLLLTICVLFCMLLAGILYQETWTQSSCSALLSEKPTVKTAELIRLRKRQQGNLTVSLRFASADGAIHEGKRLTMKTFAKDEPDPKEFSVIYPEAKPSCWVLSETFGSNDINWAKRRYMQAFNFLVATSFLIVGLWGTIFSLIRIRQKRPFVEDVALAMKIST